MLTYTEDCWRGRLWRMAADNGYAIIMYAPHLFDIRDTRKLQWFQTWNMRKGRLTEALDA